MGKYSAHAPPDHKPMCSKCDERAAMTEEKAEELRMPAGLGLCVICGFRYHMKIVHGKDV